MYSDMYIIKPVSFNISKVRFLTHSDQQRNELVVTGSCWEEVNRISLWQFGVGNLLDPGIWKAQSEQENGLTAGVLGDSGDDPRLANSLIHSSGSIIDMEVHKPSGLIATASSGGTMHLYKCPESHHPLDELDRPPELVRVVNSQTSSSDQQELRKEDEGWKPFHTLPLASLSSLCIASSSVDAFDPEIRLFVGDDLGRIGLVDVNRLASVRPGDHQNREPMVEIGADVATVNACRRYDSTSVATVNQIGQAKTWDLRCGLERPQQRLIRPGDPLPFHCLSRHPGQPYLMFAGGESSSYKSSSSSTAAYMWDLRATEYPLVEIDCTGGTVWEALFHPTQPRHLFAATESAGLVCISCRSQSGVWTELGESRNKLGLSHLLPIGNDVTPACSVESFDATNRRIICAHSDSFLQTLSCEVRLY